MGMGEDKTCPTILLYWMQSINIFHELIQWFPFFSLVKIEI
jgi:hypothetical protein